MVRAAHRPPHICSAVTECGAVQCTVTQARHSSEAESDACTRGQVWNYRTEPDTSGYFHTEGRQPSAGSEPPCAAQTEESVPQGHAQNVKNSLTGEANPQQSTVFSPGGGGVGGNLCPVPSKADAFSQHFHCCVLGLGWGAVTMPSARMLSEGPQMHEGCMFTRDVEHGAHRSGSGMWIGTI